MLVTELWWNKDKSPLKLEYSSTFLGVLFNILPIKNEKDTWSSGLRCSVIASCTVDGGPGIVHGEMILLVCVVPDGQSLRARLKLLYL